MLKWWETKAGGKVKSNQKIEQTFSRQLKSQDMLHQEKCIKDGKLKDFFYETNQNMESRFENKVDTQTKTYRV